jgi:hypothetical protein
MSGRLFRSTGVGTATTKNVASARSRGSEVIVSGDPASSSADISRVRSIPRRSDSTFSTSMSKPTVPGNARANASATGNPT